MSKRCSAFEFPDLKVLLHKTGCTSRPLPGQRIQASSASPHPSILRRPPASGHTPMVASQRHVKFDPLFISSDDDSEDDSNSERTFSQDFGPNGYIDTVDAQKQAELSDYAQSLKVQQIPQSTIQELVELGTLDRLLSVYSRDIGRMSIDSFRPFRSAYFYSVVMYHLGKEKAPGIADAVKVCDAAVVLNNATAPKVPAAAETLLTPSLLAFLEQGVQKNGGRLIMPSDGLEGRDAWREADQARMGYAMAVGHQVANLDEPAVQRILQRHIDRRCIIRPVYHYHFQSYIKANATALPVEDAGLQFQIYSTVAELLERAYTAMPPLSYVMFTTLFAIAVTNEKIVESIPAGDTLLSVFNQPVEDDDGNGPMNDKEQICILDWDFAAVLGYLLAHRFHAADKSQTEMRAKLGALAFSVDTIRDQPFPPMLPLQDTKFHQYIHRYISAIYARWPYGFVYMVIDEAVAAYNMIIQSLRQANKP
ncbi:hypothetical protein LPJ53_004655 [Coemansia erecta]|uniref:Uncharacterized protein n=1 Tax=Coemansia erecta TaxID=147472 RepID=A0A9W7XZB7_9FUNG|nr:hypothetical protein LPJ53_004655 [Coemansia erecta]